MNIRGTPFATFTFLLLQISCTILDPSASLLVAEIADDKPQATATEEWVEIVDAVTPRPVTEANLVLLLTSGTYQERVNAISAIPALEINQQEILPYLIENLQYDGGSPVRKAAAIVIGRIGQDSESAVPALVIALEGEGNSVPVKREVITALGKIGHPSAIPYLANMLYYERESPVLADKSSSLRAAEAIELILGMDFSDQKNNRLNSEGIPIIVVEARTWWETDGQFQSWPPLPESVSD